MFVSSKPDIPESYITINGIYHSVPELGIRGRDFCCVRLSSGIPREEFSDSRTRNRFLKTMIACRVALTSAFRVLSTSEINLNLNPNKYVNNVRVLQHKLFQRKRKPSPTTPPLRPKKKAQFTRKAQKI